MKNSGYYPKGSMCVKCKKAMGNCSSLPFQKMPVIEINKGIIHSDGSYGKTVKCTEYVKHDEKV